MIKYFCDKCGKEVGEFEAYTILVEAPEIKSWTDQYMYERRGYQVCRDCMAKIADFIEPQTERLCNNCKYYGGGEVCDHPSIGEVEMGGKGDTFPWIKETPEWCPLKPQTERSE